MVTRSVAVGITVAVAAGLILAPLAQDCPPAGQVRLDARCTLGALKSFRNLPFILIFNMDGHGRVQALPVGSFGGAVHGGVIRR